MRVKAKDLHGAGIEKVAQRTRRLAAEETQRVLQQQMQDKLERDYLDDLVMSDAERKVMKPVLSRAKQAVVAPHVIAVNLP